MTWLGVPLPLWVVLGVAVGYGVILALNGVAGAGILLTEFDGTAITLGTATTPRVITAGSNTLTFGAQLKGQSSTTGTVGTGTFDAVTHFALAYQ